MEVAERVELFLQVTSFCPPVVRLGRQANVTLCLFPRQEPDDSLVVFSGCGTSGRLAFLIAVNTSWKSVF